MRSCHNYRFMMSRHGVSCSWQTVAMRTLFAYSSLLEFVTTLAVSKLSTQGQGREVQVEHWEDMEVFGVESLPVSWV
jgi:hypothetical protein